MSRNWPTPWLAAKRTARYRNARLSRANAGTAGAISVSLATAARSLA